MGYSAKRAQQSQEESQKMIEEAVKSIKNYTKSPEDVKELADFMAQFPQYSMKNQLLIQNQYSGATATAGYKQFEDLGYHVQKGQKAIRILAPQKREYIIPEDGSAWIPKKKWTKEQKQQVKNKEVKTFSQTRFKRVSVFDISQTDMPKEEAPRLLPNRLHSFDMTSVEDESKLYQALVNVAESKNIPVQVASTENASKGYAYRNSNGKVGIVLSNRLDSTNRIPTLIHEMTHAFIHFDKQHQELSQGSKEFQAEFSSYITSKAFGIDTSEKAIPYIAEWTDRLNALSDEELVDLLEDTQRVSRNIIRSANEEWERLTDQERQDQVRQQEDMVHHVESFERQEKMIQQKEAHDEQQSELQPDPITSSANVLLVGATTLEIIEKAKQEDSSRLSFKINGNEYLLATDRATGDSTLINRGSEEKESYKKVIGEEKYAILKQIDDAGYLPMSTKAYQRMDNLKEKHLYPSHQGYGFLKEATSQDKEKFKQLNTDYDANTGLLNHPFVSIEWSEYDDLKDGQILTLGEATKTFNQLNQNDIDEGYSKTKINLHLTPNEYYSATIYSGDAEEDFQTQLKENYPHQLEEIELFQLKKDTKGLSYDDPEEWENIKINTEFKGHQFQYNVQVNRVDYQIKGTYQRDQEAPREATEKSCLNALQYALNNHEMDESMTHTLNKAIEESQNRQERTQIYQKHQEQLDKITSSDPLKEENKITEEEYKQSWKKQVQQAKSVNILELAEASGIHLVKDSRDQYRDGDNHSMVFTPSKNSFYENNGQYGGDPITFVQKVIGIDNFKEAVNYINRQEYEHIDLSAIPQKEPYQYDASKEVKNFSKAKDYLVNKRAISLELVDQLHNMGLIKQDKRNNVLFLWTNPQREIKGCTEQGTVKMANPINGRDHWKAIQRNSETGEGFNFGCGRPENLKFFESSIDALSYASVKGLEANTHYIAMDGLKESTVLNFIQRSADITENHIQSIELCVDNDEAGQTFIQKFNHIKQYNYQDEEVTIPIKGHMPQIPKELTNQVQKWDWNNEAVYQKEKKSERSQTQSIDRE